MPRNMRAVRLAAFVSFVVALFSASGLASSPDGALPSSRITSLHQWIVDRMTTWSPPGIAYVKDARESEEEGKRRYEDIANAIISIAYDPMEKPVFQGRSGRAMTAALLTSVAFEESAFRKDVDSGIGPLARGDSGRSWCMVQVMMGLPAKNGRTLLRVVMTQGGLRFVNDPSADPIGWGGEDLVQDRTKCFRVGVRLARMSFSACSRLPVADRLSMYASGRCESGGEASRRRVGNAQRWLWKSRPPLLDEEAMRLLHEDVGTPVGKEHAVNDRSIVWPWLT